MNERLKNPPLHRWAAPLSALLLILSFPVFPHFQLWPLVWIALVPLILRMEKAGWREALLQGFSFGYPFMVGVLAWVKYFGVAPWLALCVFEGAWLMGFTLLVSLLAPLWRTEHVSLEIPRSWSKHLAGILLPACAWIFIEWMRSLGKLSIPWGNLSHTHAGLAPLVATARWWGGYGVSFMMVAVNCAVVNILASRGADRRRAGWTLMGTVLLIVTACIVSNLTLIPDSGAPIKTALIQGNMRRQATAAVTADPLSFQQKELAAYVRLSARAAAKGAAVIAWPEDAVPGPLFLDFTLRRALQGVARSSGAFLVVGSPHFAVEGPYNSAFVLSPNGNILGRYDKQHLVPFGEYTPFWRPFFTRYGAPQIDLVRGRGHAPVSTTLGRLGVMICYETMFPQIARQTTLRGADLLFVVTNDQWFGDSSAPYDHADNAAFRAAETGRWIAQAGNTGISLFADPSGHTYDATPMFREAVDIRSIYRRHEITLYTRLGDWPPILSILVLLIAGAVRFRKAREIELQPLSWYGDRPEISGDQHPWSVAGTPGIPPVRSVPPGG